MLWCPACSQPQPEGERCLDCNQPLFNRFTQRYGGSQEELLQDALAMVAQGHLLDAHSAFEKLSYETHQDARPWLGLVLALAPMTDRLSPSSTISSLRELAVSQSTMEAIWVLLEHCEGLLSRQHSPTVLVRALLDRNLPQDALFALDFALAAAWRKPAESAPLWVLKAEAELLLGHHEDALGALRQAQALGSENCSVRYLEGLDLERQGEREQALAAYDSALANSGLRPMVLFSKARLLAEMSRLDEALMIVGEAARLLPSHRASWSLLTKIALMLGRSAEARHGIEALQRLDNEPGRDRLPGYPAPGSLSIEARPAKLFSIKLRRILELRGLLRPEQILVQDWCFGLPSRSARWPLGAFAGQNLLAEVITRGRVAFVARYASPPQLVGPSALGHDELNAWCMLLGGGQLRGVTFATNTLLSPETEAEIERAKERLWEAAPEGCRGFDVTVVGQSAGVLG